MMRANRIARAGFLLAIASTPAAAQTAPPGSSPDWPARPVRLIVPSSPGGGVDTLGRIFSKNFYESMGQRFVVDNRAGAGTMLGTELAAKSPPDGYTVLLASAAVAVNAALPVKLNFDPLKELAPVAWVSSTPLMLATHRNVPVRTVTDLVALARARRGQLNGASSGNGTTSHMSIEMLKQVTGIQFVHVPYNGAAPASIALISGEVDFIFSNMLAIYPQVRAGKLRALAVTTAKRSGAAPEVPTMGEHIPGFESDNWYGFFVPAGTPREIIVRLNAESLKALKSPEVLDAMRKEGADPVGSTPEELATKLKREVDRYGKIIKAANIRAE